MLSIYKIINLFKINYFFFSDFQAVINFLELKKKAKINSKLYKR